jgi:hypothetical protein
MGSGAPPSGIDTYDESAGMKPNEPEQWIVISKWDRFQHYGNRTPPWIKIYTELLDDPNFSRLTHTERSTLLGLWLQYARSRRAIPLDTRWITRAINANVTRKTLESLNHAGFITFSASKPLASRASREEVEVDVDLKLLDERVLKTSRGRSEEHDDDAKSFDFDKILRDLP